MNKLPSYSLAQLSKTQTHRERKKRQKARTQADLDSDDLLFKLGEMFDQLEVRLEGKKVVVIVRANCGLPFQREEMAEAALSCPFSTLRPLAALKEPWR